MITIISIDSSLITTNACYSVMAGNIAHLKSCSFGSIILLFFQDFPSQAYFGVFDGHGGVDCACYTVAHFHNNIASQDKFTSDLDDALNQAFLTTDKLFLEKAKNEVLDC